MNPSSHPPSEPEPELIFDDVELAVPRDVPTHPAPPSKGPTDDEFKLAVLGALDVLRDEVADIKKAVEPIRGKTLHDINQHLSIQADNFSRLSDSFARLVDRVVTLYQRSNIDRSRLDAAEGRLAELESEMRMAKLTRHNGS